jgi:hypothetical protein
MISEEERKNIDLPKLYPIGIQYSSSIVGLPFPVSKPPGAFASVIGYDETTGKIEDVDPAAYVIEAKGDKDLETRYYNPCIDK